MCYYKTFTKMIMQKHHKKRFKNILIIFTYYVKKYILKNVIKTFF